jgi:carboxyl-terminal processing protease
MFEKRMKTGNKILFWVLLLSVIAGACKKEDNSRDPVIEAVNGGIYDLMKDVYLWYDHLPNVDPAIYPTPDSLMSTLRYKQYDRWSFVLTKEQYNEYFTAGEMIGHGFMLGLDRDGNIRIALIYPTTQAYQQGVRRGWIITKVNGTDVNTSNIFNLLGASEVGITNNITFINGSGETVDLSLTKEVVSLSPVVYSTVLNEGDKKIGYMVFQDFIDNAKPELDSVFDTFRTTGIDDLVIDLRYNGGGAVDVAQYLASWILGKNDGGQPFVNFRHNDKLTSWDTTLNVPANANALTLNRVFFIGTANTASASELTINGVKPYLTSTVLIGSTTDGKPVGMYAFPFTNYDYVVLPICFRYTNANNVGDFYSGLTPDIQADDDLTRDFGDPEESSLKAALDYIASNGTSTKSGGGETFRPRLIGKNKGVYQFMRAH